MADEMSDTVTPKQISSFIRYIDFNTKVPIIRKDFLNFVFFSDLSGSGLASVKT